TLVEADDIHAAPTARMRVRAGQHFERLLAARNLGRYAGGYRTAYPIAAAPAGDSAALIAVAQAWVAWMDGLVFTGSGAPAGWVPDRLEYAFGTSSPDGITLEAEEYSDGRL